MIPIVECKESTGAEILLNLQTATECLTNVRNVFLDASGGCIFANDLEHCLNIIDECRKCRLINGIGCHDIKSQHAGKGEYNDKNN
ncbi:hypothetical protein [Ructibacterium gallinarum]|uniref:Uncharacterized protein n=1 Tax=Ructibacterium gallinarum TaxID=2779355 RepID=A0A9D5M5V0_9FIRM|nr:hypothetical protein [Ructibacterium gallinarum]MBE5041165.1 hypothetical protein [Ructibacterium gallinarum]